MTEEIEEQVVQLSINTGAKLAGIISETVQNIAVAEESEPEEAIMAMLVLGISGLHALTEDKPLVTQVVTSIAAEIENFYTTNPGT